MRSNYRLSLLRSDGSLFRLDFHCTRYQIDKVFYAMSFAMFDSSYCRLELYQVVGKRLVHLNTCRKDDSQVLSAPIVSNGV